MKSIILVVDDDELDVRAVTNAIDYEQITAQVLTAANGKEALTVIETQKNAAPLSHIVVLLDISMPLMDGHEFMQKLRTMSTWGHISVFYFTTSDHDQDLLRAYGFGIQGYLVKSADTQVLREQMRFIKDFLQHVKVPVS